MTTEDYIAFRNRDIHYFTTGRCNNPQDIFELSVIHNDMNLLEILYINYRHRVELQTIMDYAVVNNRKHIVKYLHEHGVKFSEDAVIKTALYGNKETLEFCLSISTKMTNINKCRFANAIFKGGLDTTVENSKLGVLIHKVLK